MTEYSVAYVLLRFPCVTETFIAEEIRNVQEQGIKIHLYSLLVRRDKLIQPVSQNLLPLVQYVPGLCNLSLLLSQAYYIIKAPTRYFSLLKVILKQPTPRNSFLLRRLVIFFKGVWLARKLEHTPVKLIHTHFAWVSAIAGIVVSQLLDIPFTVTCHAYDIYSERNDLLPLACRFANRIITISETNKRAIIEMNPDLPAANVEVLHCGIDLEYFHDVPARPINKTIQITSVGSLVDKKGHEYLIRACSLLKMQKVDFQSIIVGSGSLERPLKNLIHELELENHVTMVGAKTQEWVRDRLSNSDLFVLACVTEDSGERDGIPVALMEALAMGVPVISTPVSGIPELVRDEVTGLLVPERNAERLAKAICRLAEDKSLRQKMLSDGLDLITREYNIRINSHRLCNLFESIIKENH